MIGAIIIFVTKKENTKLLVFALSFASTIMIGISITDLIPTAYSFLNKHYTLPVILLVILLGIIFTFLIDKYIPETKQNTSSLYKIGIFSMLAICLHNIPEGIITFISSYEDLTLGISLTIAITLHNIPEGISISLPIYYSTKSKFKALLYTFISGISEPIGGLIIYLLLGKYINDFILNFILLFVAGMMSYLGIVKLLPEALKNKKYKLTILSIITGICILLINHFIF